MIEHCEAGVLVRVKQWIIYKAILLKQLEMFVFEVSESFRIHVGILSSAQSFPLNTNAYKFSFPYTHTIILQEKMSVS